MLIKVKGKQAPHSNDHESCLYSVFYYACENAELLSFIHFICIFLSLSPPFPQITHTALQERSWRASSKAWSDVAVTSCQISSTTVFTLCSGSWTDRQVRSNTCIFHLLQPPLPLYIYIYQWIMSFWTLAYCSQLLIIPSLLLIMVWHVVQQPSLHLEIVLFYLSKHPQTRNIQFIIG